MNNRWGKGEPVSLNDLLKITPVANELMYLSEELNMSISELLMIVSQIIDGNEKIDEKELLNYIEDERDLLGDAWDELELESIEDEMDHSTYVVNVKISGAGRFPQIGFKAGVNDKEDMNYFFDMVLDMLDKLE